MKLSLIYKVELAHQVHHIMRVMRVKEAKKLIFEHMVLRFFLFYGSV